MDDLKLTVTSRLYILMTWYDDRIVYISEKEDQPDINLDIE